MIERRLLTLRGRQEADRAANFLKRSRDTLKTKLSKKRDQRRLMYAGSAALALLLTAFVARTVSANNERAYLDNQVQHKQTLLQQKQELLTEKQGKLSELNTKLEDVSKQKADTERQLQEKSQQEADMKAKINDLEAQLQAKADRKQQVQIQLASYVEPASSTASGCGDNWYANFIYMHESSCNLAAVNSIGCYGIGQDCNGELAAACPYWRTDYACQNQFFTNYMLNRYGSWANAYSFWVANNWW